MTHLAPALPRPLEPSAAAPARPSATGTQWVKGSGKPGKFPGFLGKPGTQWGKCSHVPGKVVQWRRFRLSRAREPLIQYDLKRVFYF